MDVHKIAADETASDVQILTMSCEIFNMLLAWLLLRYCEYSTYAIMFVQCTFIRM